MPESWDVNNAKTKPICCSYFMAVLPLFYFLCSKAKYDAAAMSIRIISHLLVSLMERFQGQLTQDYIRNFLRNWKQQASTQLKHIFWQANEMVGFCVWVGRLAELQKRSSQTVMSPSHSPLLSPKSSTTFPKTAHRTELAAVLSVTSLSQ